MLIYMKKRHSDSCKTPLDLDLQIYGHSEIMIILKKDIMTAANPPELTPTKNVHNQSMSIFMKESDIMTAANPPEFRPTNIWA